MLDSRQTVEATGTVGRNGDGQRLTRTALWVALAVSLTVNAVASSTGDHVLLGIAAGLVALACGCALVVQHRRRRR